MKNIFEKNWTLKQPVFHFKILTGIYYNHCPHWRVKPSNSSKPEKLSCLDGKRQKYILMQKVLIPRFPSVWRESDTEEETPVLIDTPHHHLSIFTSAQGFDGNRQHLNTKTGWKAKKACSANQIVWKINRDSNSCLCLSRLDIWQSFVCVCVFY